MNDDRKVYKRNSNFEFLIEEFFSQRTLENLESNYITHDTTITDLMFTLHNLKGDLNEIKKQTQKPKSIILYKKGDTNSSFMSTSSFGRTTSRSSSRSRFDPIPKNKEKQEKVFLTSPKVSINLNKTPIKQHLNKSTSSFKKAASKREEISRTEVKKQLNFTPFANGDQINPRLTFKFEPKKKNVNLSIQDKPPFQFGDYTSEHVRNSYPLSHSSSKFGQLVQNFENEKLFNFINERSNAQIHRKLFEYCGKGNNLKNININLRLNFLDHCLSKINLIKEKQSVGQSGKSNDIEDILEYEILSHKVDLISSYKKRLM